VSKLKNNLKSLWKKKWLRLLLGLLFFFGLLFLLRYPILRGAANFLIVEDDLEPAEVIIVLSGGAYDRGMYAAQLFEEGYAPKILCAGGNTPPDFEALQMDVLESELTVYFMGELGVPESAMTVIPESTSTLEESEVLLEYLKENGIKSCIVVSSKFHTRRVNFVFRNKYEEAGIELMISGAPSQTYKEREWWKDEYGLLAVNNEYVKLLYYWLKY
jgi:uncharacterized SAM-binding protein YcdF (DUF218 family)